MGLQNIRFKALSMFVSGETFGTEDPRTGEIYTQVAEAQEADVHAAVKAARMVHTHSVVCLKFIVHLLFNPSQIHSASVAQTQKQDCPFVLKSSVSLITQCPVDSPLLVSCTASSLNITTCHPALGKCLSEQLDKHFGVARQIGCILFKCYTR